MCSRRHSSCRGRSPLGKSVRIKLQKIWQSQNNSSADSAIWLTNGARTEGQGDPKKDENGGSKKNCPKEKELKLRLKLKSRRAVPPKFFGREGVVQKIRQEGSAKSAEHMITELTLTEMNSQVKAVETSSPQACAIGDGHAGNDLESQMSIPCQLKVVMQITISNLSPHPTLKSEKTPN